MHRLLLALPALAACTSSVGDVPLDLALTDENPASASYGTEIVMGPQGDSATAWYFTHAT